jgi:hypothetical protein
VGVHGNRRSKGSVGEEIELRDEGDVKPLKRSRREDTAVIWGKRDEQKTENIQRPSRTIKHKPKPAQGV